MEQSLEINLNSNHVKKLSIPATSLVNHHVVYHIVVSVADYSWIVKRRYREFYELHEKLTKQVVINQNLLPSKRYIGNLNPEHIEKRRLGLESYLQDLVNQFKKIPRDLQTFLEFHIYDILAVTQTLAEQLFKEGDSLLSNEEPFVATPLQLYCICKRLKLPIPTCVGEGYFCDVGNLYDIVYCIKNLKIVGDDNHELIGLSSEEISFDLSLFKNLESLEILNCNIESLPGTYFLQEYLRKLSVHSSLHLLKDILIDQEVWTHDVSHGNNDMRPICSHALVWKNLTEVDFSHNSISYVDESLTLLHELERLDLSYNEIKEIEHLQELPNLRELNLAHNQIESLEGINTKLGNIKTLNLASNKVKVIKSGMPKMYSLVELDLSENCIEDITDVMLLADLPCLEVLNLLGNPVATKEMYRMQLLTAFEERISQVCLDMMSATPAEINDVKHLLAEIDSYEIINHSSDKAATLPKARTRQKKVSGRKIKIEDQDVIENSIIKVSSLPNKGRKFTKGEEEFKNRVEQIRHLGGDAWLGLLNELQNEYKDPVVIGGASLPERTHSYNKRDAFTTLCSTRDHRRSLDFPTTRKQVPTRNEKQSSLQFGFSAPLEGLVNKVMEESKDVDKGSFIVTVDVVQGEEKREEERMVGVDLAKCVLMEIAIDSGKTCAKHKLRDITSVDILEASHVFYVDLLHTQSKELRHHRDFPLDSGHSSSTGDFKRVAKYKMRTMKDAAELFVLLYKFISDSSALGTPETQANAHSIIVADQAESADAAKFSNPIGIPTDLFHQFLTSKFRNMELTESACHAVSTETDVVHLVLWTTCLPYALPQHELRACLVLTNLNIYLIHLKNTESVTSCTKMSDLERRLPLLCCLPLAQLRIVISGLFEQGFRLEFSKRGPRGTFTILTRDSRETETFLKVLGVVTETDITPSNLANSGGQTDTGRFSVIYPCESKLELLKQEIERSCGKAFKDDECILMYTVVREIPDMTSTIDEDTKLTSYTRTLVATNWRLFLCEEDHVHWPLPSYVRVAPSTPQWVVTKFGDVSGIIGIEVFDVIGDKVFVGSCGMSLLLEQKAHALEDSCHETWNLVFKVDEEREQLQRSLSQIWSYNFHGNLQISRSRSLHAQKIYHSTRVEVPAQFFQESNSLVSSPPGSPSQSRPVKGHRRNASAQYCSHHHDTIRASLQTLHHADTEILENFFAEKLRLVTAGPNDETLVCYAWTGCVAYCHPTQEIHVWLVLSNLKVYIVADSADRTILGTIQDVSFGPGTELCFHWFPLTSLRQVCVGFFDQTFRLEADESESTFTFITRDYQVTNYFLENLKNAVQEIKPESPPPKADEDSPSIYDTYRNHTEEDEEHSSEKHFHHAKGVVHFVYPNDDSVEILKHSILEFSRNSDSCDEMTDVSILMYLLVFQVVDGKKLSRTFLILDQALCLCLENHVNFPLPLFVKGLPVGSRYKVERLRSLVHIKRIEVSGFNTEDFTIVFEETGQRPPDQLCPKASFTGNEDSRGESLETTDASQVDSARPDGEDRWSIIAQTYEEKEKALSMILKFWKEKCASDLPVFRI